MPVRCAICKATTCACALCHLQGKFACALWYPIDIAACNRDDSLFAIVGRRPNLMFRSRSLWLTFGEGGLVDMELGRISFTTHQYVGHSISLRVEWTLHHDADRLAVRCPLSLDLLIPSPFILS